MKLPPIAPIITADCSWRDGVPISNAYGDVYFSATDGLQGGLEESRYVFLHGNHLEERISQLVPGETFTVAEFGFGTGLNICALLELWHRLAPAEARLHIFSIEKHPFLRAELQQLYQQADHDLPEHALAWLDHYPPPMPGIHHTHWHHGHIHLTLHIGEAADIMPNIHSNSIDAWFLDGFAPACNPDAWEPSLCEHIARSMRPAGTLATFTAAAAVRRALAASGITMQKIKGYGLKREMLIGAKDVADKPEPARKDTPDYDALIIGAGIAGASVAHALAGYGKRSLVLERGHRPAEGASGNPAGILYPLINSEWDAATAFYLGGMAYSHQLLSSWPHNGLGYALCGMEQSAKDGLPATTAQLQAKAERLGLPPSVMHATASGYRLPEAGWVNVPAFTRHLLDAALITEHYQTEITALKPTRSGWEATSADERRFNATHIIIASAWEAAQLCPEHQLPMRTIRGQITYLRTEHMQRDVSQVECHQGYLTPAIDGIHYLGATFDKDADHTQVTPDDHAENLAHLRRHRPGLLKDAIDIHALEGRAALRTVSTDRMPIIGALYNPAALKEITSQQRYHPALAEQCKEARLPGAYVSLAHAARGIVSAPIAGAIIAAEIAGTPMATHPAITALLDPIRFALKAWKRPTNQT